MDGRKLLWLGGLIVGGALGCSRPQTVPNDPYSVSPAVSVDAQGKATPETRAVRTKRGKDPEIVKESDGKPVAAKPINMVRIGDAQAEAAADPSAPPEQRQKALSVAKQNYQRAIKADPKLVAAYLGLARACSRANEHDQAIQTLDAALAKLPKEAALWHERGMVLGRLKQFDEALTSLQQAAKLAPDSTVYAKNVGMMFARQGNAEEAIPWLRRAMTEADAHYNVARMMRHIGNEGESQRQLQLALRADPDHAATLAMSNEGRAPATDPLRLTGHTDGDSPATTIQPVAQPTRIITGYAEGEGPAAPIQPVSQPTRIIVDAAPAPAGELPQRPGAERRAPPMMPVVSDQWDPKPALPGSLEGPKAVRKDSKGRPAVQIGFEPNH